jgi:hypothetical protein
VRKLHRLVRDAAGDREAGKLDDHVGQRSRCLEILNVLREEADGRHEPPLAAPPDASGTWRNGAEDTLRMLTALAQDQPAPIKAFDSAVPAELVGLIARLLAKVPDARPQYAQSVAATLAAIEDRVAASRSSEYSKPRCGITRDQPWWVTALQVLVAAALAVIIYSYSPSAFRMICDQAQDAIETMPSPFSRR